MEQLSESPDIFLIFGSPVVTGYFEGNVNYAKVLVENLKDLRFNYPSSSIKVVIPEKAGRDIVDSIVKLGIYDIFQAGTLTVNQIPEILKTHKTIADYQKNISKVKPESSMDKKVGLTEQEDNPSLLKKIINNFKRERVSDDRKVVYVSHPLITVWTPLGNKKADTSLNLSTTAVNKGFNTVLVEFDLAAPLLDAYYNIPQTGIDECRDEVKGAGVMTLGEDLKPEHVPELLIKTKSGVLYLPAGNKLGSIGTPKYTVEQLKNVLQAVYHRDTGKKPSATIVNAGGYFEFSHTLAALELATTVVIPVCTPEESELVKRQLSELGRIGLSPDTVELNTCGIQKVCSSKIDLPEEIFNSELHPDWEKLFNRII
ncbi:MAG: hypothetical protein K9L17_08365 [Clostridiales bacterium]|nr:hypothetical protein [Clostridiales bacterium]MCF8022689.1 hypothetical protein [Clostridiales bacterium]